MAYRVIIPAMIKAARGSRSLRQIVENAGHKFGPGELSSWESGRWRPGSEKVPHLLKGLGCKFEDISLPYEQAEKLKIFPQIV